MGQQASFEADLKGLPPEKLAYVMNNLLAPDVKIREAKVCPPEFHARFSAVGKKYIYKIMNCASRDVFRRNFYYFCERPLDAEKMREAAGKLVGSHDFRSFMAMGSTPGWERSSPLMLTSPRKAQLSPGSLICPVAARIPSRMGRS